MGTSRRSKVPSKAIVLGTVAGLPIGQLAVAAAQEWGAGPATAALVGAIVSLGVAYMAKGGRRGESQ